MHEIDKIGSVLLLTHESMFVCRAALNWRFVCVCVCVFVRAYVSLSSNIH